VGAAPTVVVVPGLGLPSYAVPTVRELGRRSVPAAVLDLPGFGTDGPRTVAPHVGAIGDVAAQWVLARAARDGVPVGGGVAPVLLAGHSTGANAALTAALALQGSGVRVGLLLAGPVFTPAQRQLRGLLGAAPRAYRHDSPRQLPGGLADLARARTDVLRVLRSGMRDHPERRLARLTVPLALVAARADAFAPRWWLQRLAAAATHAPSVRVHVVPGSHNMPYGFAAELAEVVRTELGRLPAPPGVPPGAGGVASTVATATGSAPTSGHGDGLPPRGQVHGDPG
jgi:pimeloyl-ACP methyl ester carboxylesterase